MPWQTRQATSCATCYVPHFANIGKRYVGNHFNSHNSCRMWLMYSLPFYTSAIKPIFHYTKQKSGIQSI